MHLFNRTPPQLGQAMGLYLKRLEYMSTQHEQDIYPCLGIVKRNDVKLLKLANPNIEKLASYFEFFDDQKTGQKCAKLRIATNVHEKSVVELIKGFIIELSLEHAHEFALWRDEVYAFFARSYQEFVAFDGGDKEAVEVRDD